MRCLVNPHYSTCIVMGQASFTTIFNKRHLIAVHMWLLITLQSYHFQSMLWLHIICCLLAICININNLDRYVMFSTSVAAMCSGVIHFSQSVYNVTVNETALPEYPRPPLGFISILCVSMFPNIAYSIEYPHHLSTVLPFEVDPHSGQLSATADIDYDSQDDGFEFYSFNVSCSDGTHNATTPVQVYVNPINEFQPVIDNNSLVLNIDETTPNGTLLLSTMPGGLKMITVEDKDRGPHGTVNFTLLFPLDDHFTFDPVQANLTLVKAIDFESDSNLTRYLFHELPLQIRVCDATTPIDACPLVSFPLFLIPSDDNEPMFLRDVYTAAIYETTALGSIVLTLECFDADVHYGGISAINLLDPPTAVKQTFSLGNLSSNGSIQLILIQDLDYDKQNQTYWFQVSCSDVLHSTIANVSVVVLPENDEVPIFTATHYHFTINQTALPGTIVGQVVAIDSDIDSGLPVSYAILQPIKSVFSIDSITGEIAVNTSLQYLPSKMMLIISATDGEFDSHAQVTVNIFPGDFYPPIFNETNITLSIYENITWPAVIYTLVAYDVDSPAIIYNISSDYPTLFTFNSTTAQVILSASLDRETTPVYIITLIATEVHLDGSYGNSTLTNLTIHVLDSNDNAPIFHSFEKSLTIPDSTPPQHVFHSVNCTDEDEGTNGEITYDILPQHSLFAVDRNGSVLVNISLDLPDFVLSENHTISIHCRDMGTPSLNSSQTITITITKTDTQSPQVNQSNTSVLLLENAPTGTNITALLVYDVDSLAVSLAIVNQTIPGTFSLSPLSSPHNHPNYPHLTLNGTVDREDTAIHCVELLAVSIPTTPPLQNITFTVNVTILDVNDNAPQCHRSRVAISAGAYNNTHILSLTCSDSDEGVNQQLKYELENVTPSLSDGHFTLNQMSGEVGLEGEVSEGTYLIMVVVSDLGMPPLNTTVLVEVLVSDLETPPMNATEVMVTKDERMPLLIIIILAVFALLVLVSVFSMSGICCCHWCRAHIRRKKNYLLRSAIHDLS